MGLVGCLRPHVVSEPSVWAHMNCFPSWCHAIERNDSLVWHLRSAFFIFKSHSTICPLSNPINNCKRNVIKKSYNVSDTLLTLLASKGLSLKCTTGPGWVFLDLKATPCNKMSSHKGFNYNLHFNGFVPVYYVTRQYETFYVHYVDVAPFRTDVKPFRLKGQVHASYSENGKEQI